MTEVFDMVKVKVKLSLHQAINTYGGVEVWLHVVLPLVLDIG